MLATPEQIDESIEKGAYPLALRQIKTSLYFAETTEESLKSLNTKLLKCLDLANFGVHKEISEIENIIDDKIIFEKLAPEQKANLYSTLGDNLLKIGNFEEALVFYVIRFELGNKEVFNEIVFLNIFLSLGENTDIIQIKAVLSGLISALDNNEQTIEYAAILETEILNFIFGDLFLEASSYGKYTKEFISFGFDMIETYLKSDNYEDIEKSLFIIDFLTEYGFKNLDFDKTSYLLDLLIVFVNSYKNLPVIYLQKLSSIMLANLSSGKDVSNTSLILIGNIALKLEIYDWAYSSFVGANNSGLDIMQNIKELLESMLLNKEFKHVNESELQFITLINRQSIVELKKQEMDPEMLISFLLEKIDKGEALKDEDYKIIERLTEK